MYTNRLNWETLRVLDSSTLPQTGFAITGATNATQAVLTTTTPFTPGQTVTISGVGGMTQLNGNSYTVVSNSGTTLTINVNSTAFGVYTSGGTVTGGTGSNIGNPLANASYICKLVNTSSVIVTISIDGVSDIDVCPSNSFWLYDEGKSGIQANSPSLSAGTQFSVKNASVLAGTGMIYLVTQYIVVT